MDLPEPEEGMKYMRLVIDGETGGEAVKPVPVTGGDEEISLESGMYVLVNRMGFPVNETVGDLLKNLKRELGIFTLEEIAGGEAELKEKEAA